MLTYLRHFIRETIASHILNENILSTCTKERPSCSKWAVWCSQSFNSVLRSYPSPQAFNKEATSTNTPSTLSLKEEYTVTLHFLSINNLSYITSSGAKIA